MAIRCFVIVGVLGVVGLFVCWRGTHKKALFLRDQIGRREREREREEGMMPQVALFPGFYI